MKISAVGFLFQNKIKGKGLNNINYTCTIHKQASNGTYKKNTISSPIINLSTTDYVNSAEFKEDLIEAVRAITEKPKGTKFVGATIKEGNKETEVHSIISDSLFAIRTKDDNGTNHFRVANKRNTQAVLSKNLYLTV